MKRTFDVLVSIATLPVVVPFSLLAFFTIAVEHILRGRPFDPLIYRETRISAGLPFTLYKLNIFRNDVIEEKRARGEFIRTKELEKNGGITKTGWVLKQIYMDELPQLWCVLRGDMSIVGPRPVNTESFERFLREGVTVKSQITAGITGPYQSLKDDRTASAHKLDQEYIDFVRTHNGCAIILNDLKILFRTVRVILKAKGI